MKIVLVFPIFTDEFLSRLRITSGFYCEYRLSLNNMAADTSASRVVLVTGANQGLGLGIIEVAGLRYPTNTYILCSRDVEKGMSAMAKLREAGVKANLDLMQLDVTDDHQIATAIKHVETKYGRLDGKSLPNSSSSSCWTRK